MIVIFIRVYLVLCLVRDAKEKFILLPLPILYGVRYSISHRFIYSLVRTCVWIVIKRQTNNELRLMYSQLVKYYFLSNA